MSLDTNIRKSKNSSTNVKIIPPQYQVGHQNMLIIPQCWTRICSPGVMVWVRVWIRVWVKVWVRVWVRVWARVWVRVRVRVWVRVKG